MESESGNYEEVEGVLQINHVNNGTKSWNMGFYNLLEF